MGSVDPEVRGQAAVAEADDDGGLEHGGDDEDGLQGFLDLLYFLYLWWKGGFESKHTHKSDSDI